MTATRDRSHDGPACDIEWEDADPLDFPLFEYAPCRVRKSPQPKMSAHLVTTWPDGRISPSAPLWPQTHPGRKLRSLFLLYGERILCVPTTVYESPAFWWEERSYAGDLS